MSSFRDPHTKAKALNEKVDEVREIVHQKISQARDDLLTRLQQLEAEIDMNIESIDVISDKDPSMASIESKEKRAYYTKRQIIVGEQEKVQQARNVLNVLLTSVSKIQIQRTLSSATDEDED